MSGAAKQFTEAELSAEPYSQAHLFEGLSAEDKAKLLGTLSDIDATLPGDGLRGYLERARPLLEDAQTGRNTFEGLSISVPVGQKLTGDSGPGTEPYAEMERLGAEQLSKCAFCLVAGGLGERLGYPGIKIGIVAEVTTGQTFIELYASFILAFQEYARRVTKQADLLLPLAIMTSDDTHAPTVKLLEENGNFGLSPSQLTLMKQGKVPALLDVKARIASKGSTLEMKPHGHGDVHALLHQHGLPKKWASEGREWLVLFQDTNPLPFRSLCAILGVSAKNQFVMNSVAVPRIPAEPVGGIAKLDDPKTGKSLTINVEYHQLDPLLKSTPTGGDKADESGFSPFPGNINILVFKIPEMHRCLEKTGGIVPEFVNPKWADAERTSFKSPTRLESMMQDFPHLCEPGDRVGFTQLDRQMCFTCVKNNIATAISKNPPDCALSAEADTYECTRRLLSLAGTDVQIEPGEEVKFLGVPATLGARIVMRPNFAISLEEMKTKIKGKVRISKKSTLVLDGSDIIIDGLDLDGSLWVQGQGTLKDKTVKNEGSPIVAIPEAELPSQPPSLQIRGYRQQQVDKCEMIGDLAKV